MSTELEFIPCETSDHKATAYKLSDIPEAGISDVYHSRNRAVYQTNPCKNCIEYEIPCWRPLSHIQKKRFLRCMLCERLQVACDTLEILRSNLVNPPIPYRTSALDLASAVEKYRGHAQLPQELAPKEPSSISAGPTTPVDGTSPSARSSGSLKLKISVKRSFDTSNTSSPSKRPRAADDSDVAQPTLLDERVMAEASAKTLAASRRIGFDDYQIDGFSSAGYGDVNGIRGRYVYETQKCEPCRITKKNNCWRTIASIDKFARCTECIKNGLVECDTPPITDKTLIHPGAPYIGLEQQSCSSKVRQETITMGSDKHPLGDSISSSTPSGLKSSIPEAELPSREADHGPSAPSMAVDDKLQPVNIIPPSIKRILGLNGESETTVMGVPSQTAPRADLNDWWKGGLSLPDDLLVQQLSELKKAKIFEAEARLQQASEEYATKSKALEIEKEGMIIRLEAMRKIVEVMERDVEGVTAQITSNEVEFEQKQVECGIAKMRYNLL